MKTSLILFALVFSLNSFSGEVEIRREVFDQAPFISHTVPGQWSSYLIMNVAFKPVKEIFPQIDILMKGTLNKKNARTEAHITVISPVEFHKVLKDKISIQEIHDIALKNEIQKSKFEIICLGKGEARDDSTIYLVVKSKNLLKIRKEVFSLFKERGGRPSQFDPELFYPDRKSVV